MANSDIWLGICKACNELPEGWQVVIYLERGSGWAELYDADADRRKDLEAEVSPDHDLHEQVTILVDLAKKAAA